MCPAIAAHDTEILDIKRELFDRPLAFGYEPLAWDVPSAEHAETHGFMEICAEPGVRLNRSALPALSGDNTDDNNPTINTLSRF